LDLTLPYLFPALLMALGAGAFLGYVFRRVIAEVRIRKAEDRAQEIIEQAKEKAVLEYRKASLKHKDLLHKLRAHFEEETEERKQELSQHEKRLLQKEANLDKRVDLLDRKADGAAGRETLLVQKEQEMHREEKRIEKHLSEVQAKLHEVASMSPEQAREGVLKKVRKEVEQQSEEWMKRALLEAREKVRSRAREMIVTAIERYATDHTSDATVTVVHLPGDEMKARVIGKEGRNVRALEMATGVDIIIDDTPGAVLISGFDPIRRQVAKTTLEYLVSDGRIHPSRIEEAVERARRDLDETIRLEGEKAVFELGIGDIHPEMIKLLGRLQYRTSYGQNVLVHSKETAYLMGAIAAELDWDIQAAKRVGLLHDIGKAISHESEGAHAQLGAEFASKHGESPEVVEAIAAHHEDEGYENRSVLAILTQACDALSAARPGARGESLERYIKRLGKLEEIANSFEGVQKSYAIQAGREVRVMVYPERVEDTQTNTLARQISKQIQSELSYPGQIKVMVIRETRAVEYAR
jgi:ribonucrease Y